MHRMSGHQAARVQSSSGEKKQQRNGSWGVHEAPCPTFMVDRSSLAPTAERLLVCCASEPSEHSLLPWQEAWRPWAPAHWSLPCQVSPGHLYEPRGKA